MIHCAMTLFGGIIRGIAERREREAREAVITFILALLLSLIIYCVPVLIYRFGIRHGAPLESKWKATWVGLIFWNCSFTALCLYYLISGYYDNGDFSVRAGPLDFICLSINWFLLYFPFKKTSKSKSKCAKCGAPLTETAKFCTECGDKVAPSGMIVCPSCGNTVTRGKFCPECGHKFVNDLQEPPQRTPSPYSAPSKYRDENAVTKVIKPGIETGHPSQPQGNDSPKAYSRVYVNSLGEINRESEPRPRKEDSAEEDVAKIAFICIGFVVVLIAIVVAVCMAFLN